MRAIALHPRVASFTGPENSPARLARALLTAGYGGQSGDGIKLSVACRLLLPDEKLFHELSLADAAKMDFPEPNFVLIQRRPDEMCIRDRPTSTGWRKFMLSRLPASCTR